MDLKSYILIICSILIMIIIPALYLQSLPGSLVRIYYTADHHDFNKSPTDEMTADFDGYPFDYRIGHTLNDDAADDLRGAVRDRNPADLPMLIEIAEWVRRRMTFGRKDRLDEGKSPDAAQPFSSGGGNRGLCDGYANTFAAACQTLGIPARVIELNGHVVPEAYLREAARWVMVDPTLGYYLTDEGRPLSVVEIISSYKNGNQPEASVFALGRGDDSLYRSADESTLQGIYLNGFTVVSNQQLGQHRILSYIATTFALPIAKVQYINNNSVKIGRKESMLRLILAFNGIACLLLVSIIAVKAFRQRTGR